MSYFPGSLPGSPTGYPQQGSLIGQQLVVASHTNLPISTPSGLQSVTLLPNQRIQILSGGNKLRKHQKSRKGGKNSKSHRKNKRRSHSWGY